MAVEKRNKEGPFVAFVKPGDVIVETPNGTRHSDSDVNSFSWAPMGGLQEHEGALNPGSVKGNCGGTPGQKRARGD